MSRPLSLALLLAACSGQEAPPPPPTLAPAPPPKVVQDTAAPEVPNSPPSIGAITFLPEEPTGAQSVRVVVEASDRDKDNVDVDYLWYINGKRQITRTRDNLPFRDFKKGDVLSVEVIASDGEATVQRMSREITVANQAPEFTTDPRSIKKLDGAVISARDPDGDPVAYTLSGQPQGMTIDENTGKLSYKGSEEEPGGTYRIAVVANDGDHGRAEWSFQIDVSPGSKAPPPE